MRRLLATLLFTSLVLVSTALGQTSTRLQQGTTVSGDLEPNGKHTYELTLAAEQFVYGEADQQTVDVVVTVTGPDGKRVGRWDGPARGPEPFQFDTEAAGTYRIEVAPFEDGAGAYALVIEGVEPLATTPEGRVDQLMVAYRGNDVPGGVVAVVQGGELRFAKAYGMANLTHGIPFTVETVSNIGSVSKQFTAFAITLLAERGALSLDDDIREHIPELPAFDELVPCGTC